MTGPIFAGDLDSDVDTTCINCGATAKSFDEVWLNDDGCVCSTCMENLVSNQKATAEAFAMKKCEITCELPEYDPRMEFRCSHAEYEDGLNESYTPNSFHAYCRHKCTNYDELIGGLDRRNELDMITYSAIRERIDILLKPLIEERIERGHGLADEFDFDQRES